LWFYALHFNPFGFAQGKLLICFCPPSFRLLSSVLSLPTSDEYYTKNGLIFK
jgi:hypothetical protein